MTVRTESGIDGYETFYQLATLIEELADAIKFKEQGEDNLANQSLDVVKTKVNILRWEIKSGKEIKE